LAIEDGPEFGLFPISFLSLLSETPRAGDSDYDPSPPDDAPYRHYRPFFATFLAEVFATAFFAAFLGDAFATALLADFFTALLFVLAAGFALALALDFAGLRFLPPKIDSQPLAYFSLVPTRVMVTVNFPLVRVSDVFIP
jgi:hypothetical protein